MAAESRVALMKERFYRPLASLRILTNAKDTAFIEDERYKELIEEVSTAKTTARKTSRDHWLLRRYDVLTIGQNNQRETNTQPQNCTLQCSVCSQETTGAHTCRECGCAIHAICAVAEESPDEGFGPVPIGTSVRIAVPEVDRGLGDARNIIGVVLTKTDDELQIGTKNGILYNYMLDLRLMCVQEFFLMQTMYRVPRLHYGQLPTCNPLEPARNLRSAFARKTVLQQDVCVLKIKYYVLPNAIRAYPAKINSYMD